MNFYNDYNSDSFEELDSYIEEEIRDYTDKEIRDIEETRFGYIKDYSDFNDVDDWEA